MLVNLYDPVKLTRHKIYDMTPSHQWNESVMNGKFGYTLSINGNNAQEMPMQYNGTLEEEKVNGVAVNDFLLAVLTDIESSSREADIPSLLVECAIDSGIHVDYGETYVTGEHAEVLLDRARAIANNSQ